MKFFVIHPGASVSTHDVYMGLVAGLKELGHEILFYRLDARIARAGAWLDFCWREARKTQPDIVEPTTVDVLFQAGGESVLAAMWRKPDWVIVVSAMYYPKLFLKMLKQAGMNVGLLLTESPYDDEDQYKLATSVDIAWVNERTSVDLMRICNPHTYYLPHAYDPAKHNTMIPSDMPSHDVVFVGTGFQERIDLLEAINWDGIDLGLYGSWDLMHSNSQLRKYVKSEEIDNEKAAALYRQAKIGINLHRTSVGFGTHAPRVTRAESMNPRDYELAACGCFFVSDYREELQEMFGDLVPTFSNAKELELLIRMLLDNENTRKKTAAILPRKVHGNTWLERAKRLVSDLDKVKLKGGPKWRDTTVKKDSSTCQPPRLELRSRLSERRDGHSTEP